MVIKGGSRGGGGELAGHLLRADTNERVEVIGLRGVEATTLPAALREMMAVAAGSPCTRPLYHASINTAPGEALTRTQKARAIAALEQRLGLTGHSRAVVEHCKAGREHIHVVWSRIDPATMKTVHDGWNYRAHEDVARQLEQEFGHRRVQGVHVERDNQPRPPRTPPAEEIQQAARTKLDPATITAEVTALWQTTDSGKAFAAALHEAGYVLARGDRRGFCIVDQAGGSHSLVRRIEGAKTADVNARLKDIDLANLPSVAEARNQMRQRQGAEIPRRDPRVDLSADPAKAVVPTLESSLRPLSGAGQGRSGKEGIGSETLYSVGIRLARSEGTRPRAAANGLGKPETGAGRSGSKLCNSFGIALARPAVIPAGGGIGRGRPAAAMLAGLGMASGGGRRGTGPPVRAAVPRMLTLFMEPRPMIMGGGRAAPRLTPVKGSPPERLNMRRPDGPSAETIGIIQEQINKLTAYGLATGESTAEQVQELRNVLHSLLEQAALRVALGSYYRPEHRKREPGR